MATLRSKLEEKFKKLTGIDSKQYKDAYVIGYVIGYDKAMENIDKMISDINNLNAPKTDTEYQDGFYDCEQMILDIINKYCKGDTDETD